MIKKFVKHGNSWALVIDRPILELLKIRPEDPVEIRTDGTTMIISPVAASDRKSKVRAAGKKVNARYKEAFKKLAEERRVELVLRTAQGQTTKQEIAECFRTHAADP